MLTIADSGKGIPDHIRVSTLSNGTRGDPVFSGVGIQGMRERLHQVGGRLDIDSMTGKTVIRATVNINQEE
jgi:signal transduction histidine kinase